MAVVGERRALHRVLLGHQHRQVGCRTRSPRRCSDDGRRTHAAPRRCRGRAASRRSVPDRRCRRPHARAARRTSVSGAGARPASAGAWSARRRIGHSPKPVSPLPAPPLPTLTTRKSQSGAALGQFAQRAGRQQLAIAVAAAAVDHLDLDIARQAVVLQAVVADHQVATGLRPAPARRRRGRGRRARARRCAARSAPARRRLARRRCRRSTHSAGAGVVAAVAAAGDAGRPAFGAQAFDQRDGQRRLAGCRRR